jgi:hypothetical protein
MQQCCKNSLKLLGTPMFEGACFKNFPQNFEHIGH